MTDLNYEAFKKITKEDLNAFLKANQRVLYLTNAQVQTFLEMNVDGSIFLNLDEDELQLKLNVRQWDAVTRLAMLIDKICDSVATSGLELESATPENSRPVTQSHSGSSSVATQLYSTEKMKTSGTQRGYVYWGDSARDVFSTLYSWSSVKKDDRLSSTSHCQISRGSVLGHPAIIKDFDLCKGGAEYWETEVEVYSLLKDLQGVMIPKVAHCGTVDGMCGFIAINFCEKRCTSLSSEDICQLRVIISKLHEKKIAHRDIRLENISKSEDGKIWLIDFGCAQLNANDNDLQADLYNLDNLTIED